MNAVKEWTAAICMAVLAAAMLQNLVPGGSMERMVKFIIGAFVICAIIAPISKIVPQISLELQQPSQSQADTGFKNTVEKQISSAAQESIYNLVVAELSRINIKCENVTAIMDTHEDGSISINKVVVKLAKGHSAECQTASDYLQKELGLKTEVTADEGKG